VDKYREVNIVEEGAGEEFKKRRRGGEIRQGDQVDKPDLAADFAVIDNVIKLAIIGQQI
jgi:hypothetical protein